MTKKTLLLIAMLLMASLAQALTTGWANWQNFDYSSYTRSTGNKIYWVKDEKVANFTSESNFAVKTTLTLGSGFKWDNNKQNVGLLLTFCSGDNRYAIQGASTQGWDSKNQVADTITKDPGTVIAGDWVHDKTFAWKSAEVSGIVLTAGTSYTLMFTCVNKVFSAYVDDKYIGSFDTAAWGEVWAIDEIVLGTDKDGNSKLLDDHMSGAYEFTDFSYAFTKSTPEPATLALLAFGIASFALRRRTLFLQ